MAHINPDFTVENTQTAPSTRVVRERRQSGEKRGTRAVSSIPVTILSGNLGAGKTTLLDHTLQTAGERELAVLVNDMGEVNVDAELVADGSDLEVDDGVTELSNGCICCELQDDLETSVVELAQNRTFDHLVVESSGISEPAPVARLFTTESRAASKYAVDALVTVVDTRLFVDTFGDETVPQRRATGDTDRPLSDLLVEQIEMANLVVCNKADLCTAEELDRAKELVTALQPDAEVITTEFSTVDTDRLLGVNLFDSNRLGELPGWKRALDDDSDTHGSHERNQDHDHDHEAGEDGTAGHHHPEEMYGVTSFTYRRRRPFHPGRFADLLGDLPQGIVRSKGTFWVAGNEYRLTMGQASKSVRTTAQSPWIASLPEVERDMYRSNRPALEWDPDHGDRRTELVFIGTEYDETGLEDALEAALVTDAEWDGASDSTSGDTPPSGDHHSFPTAQGDETVLREP